MGCYENAMQHVATHQPPPAAAPSRESDERSLPFNPAALLAPRNLLGLLVIFLLVTLIFADKTTFLITLFIGLAGVNGYWIGGAKIAALLAGLLAGSVLAVPMGKAMESMTAGLLGTAGTLNRVLSIGCAAVLIVLIVTAGMQLTIKQVMKKNDRWKPYDRMAGATLGLIEGVLIVCLGIWALLAIEPIAAMSLARAGEDNPNPAAGFVLSTTGQIHSSRIGGLADAINPVGEIRFLGLLTDAVEVISDPKARETFTEHPAMTRIQARESVQQAVALLEQDEAIMKVFETEDVNQIFSAFLSSPTLLKVLDETDLIADLGPMTDDIEDALTEAKQTLAP